jgi:hypothetical protein
MFWATVWSRKPKRRRKAENFLREVDSLTPGDLVVHVEHGVGRYLGIETITALGAPHACVALEYAEGQSFTCRWRISNSFPATAMKRASWTVWAAVHGRPRRPNSRNASARLPTA